MYVCMWDMIVPGKCCEASTVHCWNRIQCYARAYDKHIGVRLCGGETVPGYCYWSTKVHADSMCGKPKGEAYNPPCHVICMYVCWMQVEYGNMCCVQWKRRTIVCVCEKIHQM